MNRLSLDAVRRCLACCLPLALLVALGTPAYTQIPTRTSLCSIVKNPKKFQHRLVQFRAHYESDAFEYASLTDEHCSFRIEPSIPEELDRAVDLSRRVWIGHPGTQDKVVSANWIGTFRWHPKEVPNMTLQVQDIQGLTITCELCPGFNKNLRMPEPSKPQ